MDFIERIFHRVPDGGSGVLELMVLVLLQLPLTVLALRTKPTRWR
jgi:hypothetical protein